MDTEITKQLMKEKGITMYRLAKMTGLTDYNIGRILKGKAVAPTIGTVAKIAKALGVKVDDLLLDEYK